MSTAWIDTRAEQLRREGRCWCGDKAESDGRCLRHLYLERQTRALLNENGGTP